MMDEQAVNTNKPVKLIILGVILLLLFFTAVIAYFSSISKARDAVRVKDILLIQQFLQAYKDNQDQYPSANALAQPIGWEKYLEDLPQAPSPADGSCSSSDNNYKYTQLNQGLSYKLSFCLGSSVSGFSAGINTANSTQK